MTHQEYQSRRQLREQRIDALMDSCRDEVLKQIIGPFGLTPAMFHDKDGGNVTTLHNFKKGVVATEEDQKRYNQFKDNLDNPINREPYESSLPSKRKEIFQQDEPITSAYTGNELPRDGRMHLDHVTPVEKIERDPAANLFMSKEERVDMANNKENLVPAESNINQSMQNRDKEEWAKTKRKGSDDTNAEHYGVDQERLNDANKRSKRHVKKEVMKSQVMKQGKEVIVTGVSEAGKTAVRQAMGILLFELTNGAYIEIRRIAKEPTLSENIVEHLIDCLKNVAERVRNKCEAIFSAFVSGGVQGFVSNLLTFIINSVVTTSAKVVTIIREGLKGLWEAIKIIVNPPEGMPGIEVARTAIKIIAGVITTSLGLLFEKSIDAAMLSIPFLAPLAPIISPAITGLLTGIVTALVIFGIDRLFDWLESSGTDKIDAQICTLEASVTLGEKLATLLSSQFQNSRNYQLCIAGNQMIQANLALSALDLELTLERGYKAIEYKRQTIGILQYQFPTVQQKDEQLLEMLDNYTLDNVRTTDD